jgi:cyclohexanone monooxygenase
VLGTGVLSRPKLPGIPGIEEFKGHAFHTSRWDYKYTGGDTNGNLDGLSGQRVAVIGTGATAVQCIPIIADYAEHLYVFQRTPSSVDERNNRPTDLAWFRSLPHGWQASRILNFARIMSGIADGADLVHDKWTDFWDRYITRLGGADLDLESLKSLLDYEKMGEIRARIEAIVDDPVVAEGLKPYYNYWCKRPLFSDEYLQTFNRANVTLVNTDGRGVEQITEDSLMFDGERFEVDCIIFASGFKAKPPPNESGGFTLVGRNGISMSDKWRRDVRSLHGIYANGFPNLFVVGGVTDASSSANFTHLLTEQSTHVASVIAFCRARGIEMMEVREEAERQWADTLKKKRVYPSEYDAECTPSYFNNEGMLDQPSLRGTVYGGGPLEYFDLCRSWLIADFFRDMKVRCAQKLDGAGETASSMP